MMIRHYMALYKDVQASLQGLVLQRCDLHCSAASDQSASLPITLPPSPYGSKACTRQGLKGDCCSILGPSNNLETCSRHIYKRSAPVQLSGFPDAAGESGSIGGTGNGRSLSRRHDHVS